jgi:hypothetical protein
MSPADDQAHLLRVLARHHVAFVVVGGVAAQLHGWQGATADLDIAVSTDEENVARFNRALAAVGAGHGEIGAHGTSFMTRFGRLEVIRKADGVGGYDAWLRRASEQPFGDLTIVVAAPSDILRSKEAAARDKDRSALPDMRRSFERSGLIRPQ